MSKVINYFLKQERIKRDIQYHKKAINISIFGSFEKSKIDILIQLRDFLIENGYRARISRDLERQFRRRKDESDDAYNVRMSDKLIEISHIYIFIFFYEQNGEHNLNQSAVIESYKVGDQEILFLFENGSRQQQKSIFQGDIDRTLNWESFNWKNIGDIRRRSIMYCLEKAKKFY